MEKTCKCRGLLWTLGFSVLRRTPASIYCFSSHVQGEDGQWSFNTCLKPLSALHLYSHLLPALGSSLLFLKYLSLRPILLCYCLDFTYLKVLGKWRETESLQCKFQEDDSGRFVLATPLCIRARRVFTRSTWGQPQACSL